MAKYDLSAEDVKRIKIVLSHEMGRCYEKSIHAKNKEEKKTADSLSDDLFATYQKFENPCDQEQTKKNDHSREIAAMRKYIMFTFNYPAYWIDKVFAGTGLQNHLWEKFGRKEGDFNYFFAELDKEMQRKMLEWILENYKW